MATQKASDFRIKRRARWAKAFSQAELKAEFENRGGDGHSDARVIDNIGHDIILRRLKAREDGVMNHARKEISLAFRVCFDTGQVRPYGFNPLPCHPLGDLAIADEGTAGRVFDELARRINQGMTDDFRYYGAENFGDLSASNEIVPALVWAWNEGRNHTRR